MRQPILIILLLFSSLAFLFAQEGGYRWQGGPPSFAKLSEKVIDNNTKEAVEFATVSLFRMPKDTLIGGIVTNAVGAFELENLRPGKHKLNHCLYGIQILSN